MFFKFRQAGYCNLKVFLLFLVVYGHWIEPNIADSEIIYTQYWWIYLLHMPLFAFLSGLFLQSQKQCLQQIKRLLPMYLVLQLLIVMCSGGAVKILVPFWHLWYLLSYCAWAGIGWLGLGICNKKYSVFCGKEKQLILAVSILIGALAGYVPWLDRTFSGSRTIVFFPFFWLGLICNRDIPWQRYRFWGVVALTVVLAAVFRREQQIPATFLYHAEGYGNLHNGFWLRLLCYALSGLLGFFVLTMIPDRSFPFTKAGTDTMPVYLIHAPMVGILRMLNIHWLLCAVGSVVLIYIIYKMMKWHSQIYGIVQKTDRRGGTGFGKVSGCLRRICKIGISISSETNTG